MTADCPRAKSSMTPCVLRDGKDALAGDGACVGCLALMTSSEFPTHPDAPRADGETPVPSETLDRDIQLVRNWFRLDNGRVVPRAERAAFERIVAALLARHRDGERAEWHRRMSDEHCGTDEIVGYGPYHAEMLSDEALFLELGEEIFTVYFDKKKPCLNDGRAHRKGVLQMRYEETRPRVVSASPDPERASK